MIKERLEKIYNKILVKRNFRWADRHQKELDEEYNGKYVLIVDRQVIASGNFDYDLPHTYKPGEVSYQTNIADPYKYFGFKKEER